MEPVKITETKEWSSIDIFLFSNGQQYSPPRKYHLRSEELQWWGATISYLGRTHYGAGHSSIELYAINGTKINGPLELINGAAYVAVEPPDSFVNTGYEEYLVRASRSWEKRLAQKSNNTETSNLDSKREKDPEVQCNADSLNTSVVENIVEAEPLKVCSNSITSSQKSRPTKPYQRLQRKSITSPKQIQKKKSFDTHGAIIKRLCAETDKLISCPKKPSIQKNGFINKKPPTIAPSKPNERTNQEPSACCKKRGSIKPDSNPKTETSKNLNGFNTAPINEPQAIDLYKNNEIESMSLKNDPEPYPRGRQSMNNNEQINLNGDNTTGVDRSIHKTRTDNNQDLEKESSSKLKQINEYEKSDLPRNYNLKSDIESNHHDNIPKINKVNEKKSYDTLLNSLSEKQVTDEYIAHMNKGGLLLLKLKVKLKGCKTILNKDKMKNIPTATSLLNIPQTEKTSQADINISFSGELLKSNEEPYIQDKSLQSLLNKLYSEENDRLNTKNPRIIIIQCACRNYSDNHKYCMCDTFEGYENGNCEKTSNQKLNETFTRCDCHTESSKVRTSEDENALKSGTIFQPIKDVDNNRISFSNGTRVKDLAQKFEMSDKTMSNDKNTNNNNKQNSNNTSMNENQRQSVNLTRIFDSRLKKSIENQMREENNDSNSHRVCNKSTQTDWCNVLLEARLNEEDKYTFHLPPLYLLKQCNL